MGGMSAEADFLDRVACAELGELGEALILFPDAIGKSTTDWSRGLRCQILKEC